MPSTMQDIKDAFQALQESLTPTKKTDLLDVSKLVIDPRNHENSMLGTEATNQGVNLFKFYQNKYAEKCEQLGGIDGVLNQLVKVIEGKIQTLPHQERSSPLQSYFHRTAWEQETDLGIYHTALRALLDKEGCAANAFVNLLHPESTSKWKNCSLREIAAYFWLAASDPMHHESKEDLENSIITFISAIANIRRAHNEITLMQIFNQAPNAFKNETFIKLIQNQLKIDLSIITALPNDEQINCLTEIIKDKNILQDKLIANFEFINLFAKSSQMDMKQFYENHIEPYPLDKPSCSNGTFGRLVTQANANTLKKQIISLDKIITTIKSFYENEINKFTVEEKMVVYEFISNTVMLETISNECQILYEKLIILPPEKKFELIKKLQALLNIPFNHPNISFLNSTLEKMVAVMQEAFLLQNTCLSGDDFQCLLHPLKSISEVYSRVKGKIKEDFSFLQLRFEYRNLHYEFIKLEKKYSALRYWQGVISAEEFNHLYSKKIMDELNALNLKKAILDGKIEQFVKDNYATDAEEILGKGIQNTIASRSTEMYSITLTVSKAPDRFFFWETEEERWVKLLFDIASHTQKDGKLMQDNDHINECLNFLKKTRDKNSINLIMKFLREKLLFDLSLCVNPNKYPIIAFLHEQLKLSQLDLGLLIADLELATQFSAAFPPEKVQTLNYFFNQLYGLSFECSTATSLNEIISYQQLEEAILKLFNEFQETPALAADQLTYFISMVIFKAAETTHLNQLSIKSLKNICMSYLDPQFKKQTMLANYLLDVNDTNTRLKCLAEQIYIFGLLANQFKDALIKGDLIILDRQESEDFLKSAFQYYINTLRPNEIPKELLLARFSISNPGKIVITQMQISPHDIKHYMSDATSRLSGQLNSFQLVDHSFKHLSDMFKIDLASAIFPSQIYSNLTFDQQKLHNGNDYRSCNDYRKITLVQSAELQAKLDPSLQPTPNSATSLFKQSIFNQKTHSNNNNNNINNNNFRPGHT